MPFSPICCTAGLVTPNNHSSPICAITPLTSGAADPSPSPTSGPTEDSSGLSFQLATLDHSGRLNLWVVVEIYHPEPHGSESDLGLVPGGRVKLVKNVTMETCAPSGRWVLLSLLLLIIIYLKVHVPCIVCEGMSLLALVHIHCMCRWDWVNCCSSERFLRVQCTCTYTIYAQSAYSNMMYCADCEHLIHQLALFFVLNRDPASKIIVTLAHVHIHVCTYI